MEYIVVHMIDPLEVGDRVQHIPLHMTLLHWFETHESAETIVDACMKVAQRHQPMPAVVEGEDMFGSEHNILVNRVQRTQELLELHTDLLTSVGRLAVDTSKFQWVREKWSPHVTHSEGRSAQEGDTFNVDSMHLIQRKEREGMRQVVEVLPL